MQNTLAIVLKNKPRGETSSLLHVYSREFGKLILIAKGARTPKSSFRGLLEPFSLLNIHFNEKKERAYQFLSHAEFRDPFTKLKTNPPAVLYASVLLEIVYKIQDTQRDSALFDLLHNVLEAMARGGKPALLHSYFILHYLRLEGLMLDPEHCYLCEKTLEKAYFQPFIGQMLCGTCSKDRKALWELPQELWSLLIMIMQNNIEDITEWKEKGIDILLLNRVVWNTLASRIDNCRTLKSVNVLRKVI